MQFNLTVKPAVSYIRIKPGSSVNHTITLENNGPDILTLKPRIVDFSSNGENGIPVLSSSTAFPYLDTATIQDQELSLQPEKRAQLTLRFEVPENAEEKEYPLTVLFESSTTPAPSTESTTRLSGAIGSNIIVLISKEEQTTNKLEITEDGAPLLVNSYDTLLLTPVIKNNSFAATNLAGSVTVKDLWGKELTHFSLYPDTVLGYSTRQARAMRSPFQPDLDPEAMPIAYKNSSPLLGPHTVTITLTKPYTSENPEEIVVTQTSHFFAVPFLATTALLAVVLVVGIILVTFKIKSAHK